MVAVMPTTNTAIARIQTRVETDGRCQRARQRAAAWAAAEPELHTFSTTGEIAAECRRASSEERDGLLSCLVRVAVGDELAQLTAVAGVADRLSGVVAGWRRAGVPRSDLAAMEVDLVAECWAAIARLADVIAVGGEPPARVGWWLVDAAREAVRVPRRKERRAAARATVLGDSTPAVTCDPRTSADRLAVELAQAVREGRVSLAAVRPVFLTRVAGFDTTEAALRLGCTPAVVRAIRSRTERRLAA
jgi:hypothetical protein